MEAPEASCLSIPKPWFWPKIWRSMHVSNKIMHQAMHREIRQRQDHASWQWDCVTTTTKHSAYNATINLTTTWLQGSLEHFNMWGWLLHHKTRSLLLSLLSSLPLTALIAPSEGGNSNGRPPCHRHGCHSHCHHHSRNHPPPPLPGMHPTKVGCCLKKRDHRHCRYVIVLIVVIGNGLPHHRWHRCHPHRHHHWLSSSLSSSL